MTTTKTKTRARNARAAKTTKRKKPASERKASRETRELLKHMLEWDDWTIAQTRIMIRFAQYLRAEQLVLPAIVEISSRDETPLATFRAENLKNPKLIMLEANESKWQDPNIFPLTVVFTDQRGNFFEHSVTMQPQIIN